ncbi:MAG: hypothetical protein RR552_07030 [Oscillospiraceae bacterium]
MTSQKSSKNTFLYAFKTGLKSNALFGLIEFLVTFMALAYNPITMIFKKQSQNPMTGLLEDAKYTEMYKVFFTDQNMVFLRYLYVAFFLGAGVLLGIAAFKFITGKKTINVYYSLGIKRASLFSAKFLAGTVTLLAAIFIPAFIGIIANIAVLGSSKMIWLSGIYLALGLFSLSFFAFSITAAVFSSVGTAFEGILFSGTLICFPHAFLTCLQSLIIKLVPGTPFGSGFSMYDSMNGIDYTLSLTQTFKNFNPLLYFSKGLATMGNVNGKGLVVNYDNIAEEGIAWSTPNFLPIIIWILVSIAICAVAMFIFDKRKAEIGGFIGKNKVLNFVTTFIICMATFSTVYTSLHSTVAINLAISFALFAIVYCILDMLLIRNLREFFKASYKLPIHLGIAAVIFVFFFTGYFGFASKVPNISDIETAQISSNVQSLYDNNTIQNYYYFMGSIPTSSSTAPSGDYKSENDLKFVTDIHNILAKDGNTNMVIPKETNYTAFPNSVKIIYTLKNGKQIYRNYYGISYDVTKKLLEYDKTDARKAELKDLFYGKYEKEIPQEKINSDFARKNLFRKAILSDDNNVILYNKNFSFMFNITDLTAEQHKALRDALYLDLSVQTTEQRYFPDETMGILSFSNTATLADIKEQVNDEVTLDKVISTNSDDYDENGRRILPEKEAILSDKGNERFHYRPTFVITPDMVNTITFLKSINAFAKLSDIAEPLKAYVKPIKGTYIEYPYYYKNTLGTEFFVSANNNNDNNINNSYFTADKSIIDNLSKSAVLRHVIDVEDYILILEYDNKSSSHFYIKAKDVPEDIKKAIEISAAKNKKPDSGSIYIS